MYEVYLVTKCEDFIEGKGPYKNHSIWASWFEADKFIMNQPGIAGTKQGIHQSASRDGFWSYNGYNIERIPFINHYATKFDEFGNVVY